MRVLVCGGRNYGEMPRGVARMSPAWYRAEARARAEREHVHSALSALSPAPSIIIHGGATGADRIADVWARSNGIPVEPYKADWYPRGRTGGLDRSAGPKRNRRMIVEGLPDLIVAFPGGDGTANMKQQAFDAGIRVVEP